MDPGSVPRSLSLGLPKAGPEGGLSGMTPESEEPDSAGLLTAHFLTSGHSLSASGRKACSAGSTEICL